MTKVDILKLSDEDLLWLFNDSVDESSALSELRAIVNADILILTQGSKGSLIWHYDNWYEAPADNITSLARRMASGRTLICVSWSLQRAHQGEQPYWMACVLAAMLGQIGLPGGGIGFGYGAIGNVGKTAHRLQGPVFEQGNNPISDFIPVSRIADMLLNPNGGMRVSNLACCPKTGTILNR